MNIHELIHPAIIVVDMINGFTKSGPLADPEIAKAARPIASLIEETTQSRQALLFVKDTHEEGCLEFESFPPHCLKGTDESEIMDELKGFADQASVIEKNSISTFTAPGFSEWLKTLKIPADIVITGCCTDLCVLQLVLSLQSYINQNDLRGLRIVVPVDCVDTYHIEGIHDAKETNRFALENMKANGVKVISGFDYGKPEEKE